MKVAIIKYFKKLNKYPNYYANQDFSKVSNEIKNKFANGLLPIERNNKTDVSLFEKEFGYKLPIEIVSYINIFWHPCISGYCNTKEAIVLFSVLMNEGDTSDDLLFYKNGLITMSREWREIGGDIQRYIPIGWLGYSGGYVLYELKSNNIFLENMDVDGTIEDKPIANSLKELINNMDIRM